MSETITIAREAVEVATEPLGLEKAIEGLQELYEWVANLPHFTERDLYALHAGIEGLKLLRG